MKKKYIKLIIALCIIFLGIIFGNLKSEAATASISANNKNVNVGDKVTITVSYNACLCQLKVEGSGISDSIDYIGTDLKNKKDSKSYSLNTSKAGSYTVKLTGSVTDEDRSLKNISDSVTVVVSEKSTTTNNSNNDNNKTSNTNNKTSNTNNTETPTEPTFKSANETVYATGDINIRKSYSADSEKIGSLKTGESVTRTGVGDNGWSKVTYNGSTGYIKTSLLTTEEPAKSSDKALKTLEITPEGLDPEFDPETTSYTLTVGADVEKLDIKAAPNDENAKVEITGNESLQPGDNVVKITVTAQDETTRIYNINVKKQETVELGLTSIKVNGYTLSPKFSSNVYEYKLNVLDPSVTKLDITAQANDENAKVEISGNSNLQDGENTVVITVTSQDGTEKVIYQIYVNKSSMAGTTNNKDNMALYISIAVVALVIIIMIIIIIRSKKRKYDTDDESEKADDYSDLYGYSSKNKKVPENEETKLDSIESAYKSKQDIENELFGKLPNDDNIGNSDDTTTTTKNEDKFNYNPYVTKDIYGDYDYQKDADTEIKPNSESTYKDLYGSTNESEDFSFRANAEKMESTYNNGISENKSDSNNSMIEIPNSFESEEDYTLDDDYKIKRSKGKHSK